MSSLKAAICRHQPAMFSPWVSTNLQDLTELSWRWPQVSQIWLDTPSKSQLRFPQRVRDCCSDKYFTRKWKFFRFFQAKMFASVSTKKNLEPRGSQQYLQGIVLFCTILFHLQLPWQKRQTYFCWLFYWSPEAFSTVPYFKARFLN